MKKFDHVDYVFCNRFTNEIITISTTSTIKAKVCFDHGLNEKLWKIIEKKEIYRTEGIRTNLTKKQLLEILASFNDDEELPLLVDYSTRHGQPEYYFDNPDTDYGLCYDAIEKKFVAWAGEFEC
jgi:hypothetical protein